MQTARFVSFGIAHFVMETSGDLTKYVTTSHNVFFLRLTDSSSCANFYNLIYNIQICMSRTILKDIKRSVELLCLPRRTR